jgi:hypothetical protein
MVARMPLRSHAVVGCSQQLHAELLIRRQLRREVPRSRRILLQDLSLRLTHLLLPSVWRWLNAAPCARQPYLITLQRDTTQAPRSTSLGVWSPTAARAKPKAANGVYAQAGSAAARASTFLA